MIVDALGNPVHFMLTGGQVHDSKAAVDLLSGVQISGSNILGDKAYGAKRIRDYITEQNAVFTIPPREVNGAADEAGGLADLLAHLDIVAHCHNGGRS